MDTIAWIAAIVAAIVTGTIIWFVLRRNLPPDAAEDLAQVVAAIRQALSGIVTEAEVRAVAGWFYDNVKTFSAYYTRDQFIDLVTRAVMRAIENEPSLAQLMARDSALAAARKPKDI